MPGLMGGVDDLGPEHTTGSHFEKCDECDECNRFVFENVMKVMNCASRRFASGKPLLIPE